MSPWALLSLTSVQNVPSGSEWGFKAQINMPIDVTGLTVEYTVVGPYTYLQIMAVRYLAVDRSIYPGILISFSSISCK